jgi:tetratricopeptide (TPR) repeat protein
VIARNTAFSYKGRAIDVRQVGRELNIRYVLEGSMQRNGSRLRVNVRLVDAETGNHIWAERFDKPVADLFEMQDEIVSRLASTLQTQLIEAEARRAERSPHPNSMDLYFQGMAWFNKGPTPHHMAQARGFFERALALDPESVEALVGLAYVDGMTGAYLIDDGAARFAASETASTKAVTLAPDNALAHMLLGCAQMCTNRTAQGIAECERALQLNRNLANAHATIGAAKILIGRAAETEAHVLEALRLSPRDSGVYRWLHWVGAAKLMLAADAEHRPSAVATEALAGYLEVLDGRCDSGIQRIRATIDVSSANPIAIDHAPGQRAAHTRLLLSAHLLANEPRLGLAACDEALAAGGTRIWEPEARRLRAIFLAAEFGVNVGRVEVDFAAR